MRTDPRQGATKPETAAEPKAPPRPPVDELLPIMAGKDLSILHANAQRLAGGGASKQQAEAARVLPLIEAEVEKRRAQAPPPRARKSAAARKPGKAAS